MNATADFFEVLRSRRSVRHFTDEMVPRERILQLVEDASWAPSGGNDQPWAVTAVSPAAARALRERIELRAWHALFPKVAGLVERVAEQRLDGAELVGRIDEMIAREGVTRGAPWLLLVHTSDPGIDEARVLELHAALEARLAASEVPTLAQMRATSGPINDDVTLAGAVCFAYALSLAAQARGLGTCIQHSWLAFQDELGPGLIPAGRDLRTALLVGVADPGDPINARDRQRARRRPVAITFR
jgi:nitroreductase